jgi:hypothetical protein
MLSDRDRLKGEGRGASRTRVEEEGAISVPPETPALAVSVGDQPPDKSPRSAGVPFLTTENKLRAPPPRARDFVQSSRRR